jgi:ubiquinone/menaquinone biosynthesis C-methylase UbiE
MSSKGNRSYWNRTSDEYQHCHQKLLSEEALAWGIWRIPESKLKVLGDLSGKLVLEYGCGAAQWSIALAHAGVRVIGLDISERQLVHAHRNIKKSGVNIPLLQADGVKTPFQSASFDIVFCDHGVMSFARPENAIKETARILKPGGLFAFCMSSPIRDLCWDNKSDAVTDHLNTNYFKMDKFVDEESVSYQYGYGKWIRLFVQQGFIIEDLIELRAPQEKETTYSKFVAKEWARKWPAENIWKVRKKSN